MEKARPVSLKEIRIRDNFWDKYRRLVREEILKYQWCAMNDQIEGAPKSHCSRRKTGRVLRGCVSGLRCG